MDVVLYILGAIVILFAIYLFMIFPANGKRAKAFDGKYIAHRGLHGGDTLENTIKAFEKAVDKGYGVELDIHLSSDKIPVVAHDYDLKRVFGVDKKVSSLTASELNSIGVPTLSQVLTVLDGRVPLVAEIKGESIDTEVCSVSASVLDNYKGLYCVESFNPFHLRWFKKNRKHVIRGQLSTAFGKCDDKKGLLHQLLRHLLLNFISRPHFIAYEYKYFGFSARLCKLFGAHMICWTPKSEAEVKASKKHYKTFIFEGYEP